MTDEKRSRVLGMLLCSVSRGQFPQREPVAFLYGHVAKEGETPTHTINGVGYMGVVAPDIDTVWTDKNTFPYVVVCSWFGEYKMYISSVPMTISKPNSSGFIVLRGERKTEYFECDLDANLVAWVFVSSYTNESIDGSMCAAHYTQFELIWANHDIYYHDSSDNSVCLAASDPIPIYE